MEYSFIRSISINHFEKKNFIAQFSELKTQFQNTIGTQTSKTLPNPASSKFQNF